MFDAALQQSFQEYSLFKSITIKGAAMFRQCLPQHHCKINEYSLGVMMCAKASPKAVNGKCTSPEAHHRHIMHKLLCSNFISILICMVKSRCNLAIKFAVNLQQPYGSYAAVCAGGLFFSKGKPSKNEHLGPLITCSSSCIDAARGSPSATRAIRVISTIFPVF